ncbi:MULTISPECIES: hypothetical protein [Thalassospira]|uniref:Thymidylate kinase-like domain-containing protein n=2 Tax=Thalassospira TaxID=168934 RepID=A0A367WBM8_9PROT|nr:MULTISPECIES: hypothetical protein [Thalassospira]MDG4717688.1 hypothetical protein [Thalassospira sp. FZY0004]RCK38855.1 hypothetical protein TH19_03385 [Thalassospira profundimaris]
MPVIPLTVLSDLFNYLDANQIDYSIWKSLENFSAQTQGIGDIDVVFSKQQATAVTEALQIHGFVLDARSIATVGREILVYRTFDYHSRKYTTVHAHFACRFGSKLHKEYRFPFEKLMFKSHILQDGMKRLNDDLFYASRLLIISVQGKYNDPILERIITQLQNNPTHNSILEQVIETYFSCSTEDFLHHSKSNPDHFFASTANKVKTTLNKENSSDNYIKEANFNRFRPRLIEKIATGFGFSRNKTRKPAEIIIAGHDGTGKSTVAKKACELFSPVAPTKYIYLGRKEWGTINTKINLLRSNRILSRPMSQLWPLSSTTEIALRILIGKLYKLGGAIVIYDRPAYDICIKYENRKNISGYVARKLGEFIGKRHGDYCYFLTALPKVAVSRKPKGKYCETSLSELHEKYAQTLDNRYHSIDTSFINSDEVAAQIVRQYFLNVAGSKN